MTAQPENSKNPRSAIRIKTVTVIIEYEESDYCQSFEMSEHKELHGILQNVGLLANWIVSAKITTKDEDNVVNVFRYEGDNMNLFCEMLMLVSNQLSANSRRIEDERAPRQNET